MYIVSQGPLLLEVHAQLSSSNHELIFMFIFFPVDYCISQISLEDELLLSAIC